MLGAIIGDMCGSVYEFTTHKGKDFDIFANDNKMTDDSLLTIEVARTLLNNFPIKYDQDSLNRIKNELKINFSNIVRKMPYIGWGSMFYDWASGYYRNNFEPYNSFGNGAGMRISPVGWFANSEEEVKILSKCITEITHNHIEGIIGAEAIAMSVFMALHGKTKTEIANYVIKNYYPNIQHLDYDGFVKNYRFNVTCQGSVPQAIYCFLISNSFEDSIKTAISIGGDTDTIACMTGAIAEAFYLNDIDTNKFINKFILKYSKEFSANNNIDLISEFYEKINSSKKQGNCMNLIFLDIDGVLNCSTTTEKIGGTYRGIGDNQLKLLFSIVSKTNSKLILISSWKEHWHKKPELKCRQDELANYLDKRLNEFNMHISAKIGNDFLERGKEIKYFLSKCKARGLKVKFIILDDGLFDYKQEGLTKNLIKTNFNRGGLTSILANKSIDALI